MPAGPLNLWAHWKKRTAPRRQKASYAKIPDLKLFKNILINKHLKISNCVEKLHRHWLRRQWAARTKIESGVIGQSTP